MPHSLNFPLFVTNCASNIAVNNCRLNISLSDLRSEIAQKYEIKLNE